MISKKHLTTILLLYGMTHGVALHSMDFPIGPIGPGLIEFATYYYKYYHKVTILTLITTVGSYFAYNWANDKKGYAKFEQDCTKAHKSTSVIPSTLSSKCSLNTTLLDLDYLTSSDFPDTDDDQIKTLSDRYHAMVNESPESSDAKNSADHNTSLSTGAPEYSATPDHNKNNVPPITPPQPPKDTLHKTLDDTPKKINWVYHTMKSASTAIAHNTDQTRDAITTLLAQKKLFFTIQRTGIFLMGAGAACMAIPYVTGYKNNNNHNHKVS